MYKLITKDYIEILKYYNIPIPKKTKKNRKQIKKIAEAILAEKLCRCIKVVDNTKLKDEQRAIAICINSVIQKKKLKVHSFTCKKKKQLKSKNKNIPVLSKTVKQFKLKKKKN